MKMMPTGSPSTRGDETVAVEAERATLAFCSCIRVTDEGDEKKQPKKHKRKR